MKFDFGEVLSSTWKIGWNHKVLWLWQMLPGLFSLVLTPLMFVTNPAFAMFLPEPYDQYLNQTWVSFAFIGLMFILMLPMMFIGIVAQLTSTYGALKVEKSGEKLTFRGLFTESLPYFWRVLGLYAIFGGTWMVIWLAFMVAITLASIITFGLATLCMVPMFLLLIPGIVVAYSVLELAQAAIVADNMRTIEAISHGWKLFRANVLGVVLLMVVLYFALATLSSIFVFPMMLPMMMLPIGFDASGDFHKYILVFFFVFFPIMSFVMYTVQGILMAFFQSAWAVAYLRINRNLNAPIILEETPTETRV
ncbi:MAG: hypothetical protein U0V02_20255 [Anaerolineales bacterium]